MRLFTFIIFVMTCCLYGQEEVAESDPFTSSLVSTQSLLPTAVQSVSTISGEWLNFSTDLVVAGPEPIVLNRTYGSNGGNGSRLGSCWDFNREHPMLIRNKRSKKKLVASYRQSSGVTTIHKGSSEEGKDDETAPFTLLLSKRKGLTNCRMGEISARTNLNNTVLVLDRQKKHCTARSGNGNITYYKFQNETAFHYYKPLFERKASGNLLFFKKGGIQAYNPEETLKYGWVKIDGDATEEVLVEASDGKKVRYQFNCKPKPVFKENPNQNLQGPRGQEGLEGLEYRSKARGEDETEADQEELVRCTLAEVSADHKPTERYEYVHKLRKDDPLLKAKHWPENRFQAVRYYDIGYNKLNGLRNVQIDSKEDFRRRRVRKILAPVGIDSTPIVTHQFVYHGRQIEKTIYDGKTDVYDAYLRKTTHEYNEELRPITIKRFDKEGALYSSDHYVWDDHRYFPDFLDPRHYMEAIDWNDAKFKKLLPDLEDVKNHTTASRSQSSHAAENEKYAHEQAEQMAAQQQDQAVHPHPPVPVIPFDIPDLEDLAKNQPILSRSQSLKTAEVHARALEQADRIKEERQQNKHEEKFSYVAPKPFVIPRDLPFYRGPALLPKRFAKLLKDPLNGQLPESFTYEQLIKTCLKTSISKKENQGNLTGKYLQDANGNIFHAQFFTYDDKGNILEERFYGNLTGKNNTPIRLNGYHHPIENGVECYRKRYTYSDDRFNLLLTEEEDSGKGLENVYWDDSPLLKAKYVKDCGQIVFRQFYTYDTNTTLIKTIKDDGCGRDSEDLTGVHERHITLIHPQQQAPYGLPAVIEERYWDAPSGEEKLLRRRVCSYSKEGHLEREEHYDANEAFTHVLTWTYNPHGLVTEHVNALGQLSKKEYDLNDNVIYEEELDVRKIHTYDYANRLIHTTELHPDSPSFSISHRYDYIGNRISTTDRYGNETRYEYDDFNRLIRTILPSICDDEGRVSTPTIETQYDEADRPIASTDPNGHQTRTSYNARGDALEIIYPDGTIDRSFYSLEGHLIESIAPNGTKTVYRRDFMGRVLEENVYDEAGHLLTQELSTYQGTRLSSKVDAEGRTTTYHYDGAGRLVRADLGRQTLSYLYDASSRIQQIIRGSSPEEIQIQTFVYDAFNWVQEERQENASGKIIEQTFFAYDDRGNIVETRREGDSGTRIVRSHYNSFNQLTETIDAEGNATHLHDDHFYRNAFGQFVLQRIETDPLGRQTCQIHNALGVLCEIIKKDPFGTITAHQTIIVDPTGKPLKTIDAVIVNGEIDRHHVNLWRYHPSGQEEMIIEAAGTPLQKTTRFTFNRFSQKEQLIKPSGVRIYYFYDLLGRIIRTTSSDRTVDYRYTYNRCHQICSIEDALTSTKTICDYDADGLLNKETLAHGQALNYTYDTLGRMTHVTLPDDSAVHYHYDSALLKQVQRIKHGAVAYTHSYDRHDLTGTATQSTLPLAAGTIHTHYDRNGRVVSLRHRHSHIQVPEQGYDPAGRLTALATEDPSGQHHFHYQYNALDHLISEQSHQKLTYQTDSIHNRLDKNGVKYHVNALNQIVQQGDCTYRYDANGNIIEKNNKGSLTRFAYDALDRLTAVITEDKKIYYHYDGINRRIAKTENGNTTQYLYQGQNEIGAIDHTGEIVELRILGAGIAAEIGSTVAIELQDKVYAPLHDLLGHLTALIDAETSEIAESYRYTAFGEETLYNANGEEISTSSIGNPWRFASKRVDPETGWIYFGKRYYDPELGRWTTPDPASFIDGPNLYSYLKHNPIKSYDAYGLVGEAYAQSREAAVNADKYPTYAHEGPAYYRIESSEVVSETTHYAAYERHVNELPNVVHCHGFEGLARGCQSQIIGIWGWYDASFNYTPTGCYELNRRNIKDKFILFVNGMNTPHDLARCHTEYISDLQGGINVHFMYNATHGKIMNSIECIMGHYQVATEPVRGIHESLNKFFDTASSDATALIVCNSQGAIHVSNAMLCYNEELRHRVNVLAIAPGGYVYPETCREVIHYRAEFKRDFIPYLDRDGAERAKDTIVTLPSHPDASFFDHSFQSLTYQDALRNHLKAYIRN